MVQTTAYAYASGEIGFANPAELGVPKGALLIARGPQAEVTSTVTGLARRAYDNETLLVPGVPEAQNEGAGYAAFKVFFDRVQIALSKQGITL